mgnify:CR=1 FL=1
MTPSRDISRLIEIMAALRDPEVRRAYQDELRATAADPAKHRAFLLRSSMIQSLRDLEKVA